MDRANERDAAMLAALLQPYSKDPLKPSDFLKPPDSSPADMAKFTGILTGRPPDHAAEVERRIASGDVTYGHPPAE